MTRRAVTGVAVVTLVAACSDATGPSMGTPLDLRFSVVTEAVSASPTSDSFARLMDASLEIPAEGGTYLIDDVQLIASEFELEGPDGSCGAETEETAEDEAAWDDEGELEHEGEDCEFEGGPLLLDLPLDGGELSVATELFPDGTYTRLKFQVEDLDLSDDSDEEDATTQQAVSDMLAQLRTTYPEFPADASMVVHGRFVPTTGEPQAFTVFFDAEIEIHLPIDPPLQLPGDAALTVSVDPAAWFTGVDFLSLNGQTVEFELEMEHGFHGTEIEHDD